jgi:8-oxo-dGTP diphosphatase
MNPTRKTSRLLVLDTRQRLLLFQIEHRSGRFWMTPGGGLEQGETFEEAARRELLEETGLAIDEVGATVWHRDITVDWEGERWPIVERYFVVRSEPIEVSNAGWLPYEHDAISATRWWTEDELLASDGNFIPPDLASLVGPLMRGELPHEPVVILR